MNELAQHKNAHDNHRSKKVVQFAVSHKDSHGKFIVPWQMDDDDNKRGEKAKQ